MGYRTVVILNNDSSHEWQVDPDLGRKIAHDMNYVGDKSKGVELRGGTVVQCAHADNQTLMLLDSLHGTAVASSNWVRGETFEQIQVKLLRDMAERMGYRISKKPEFKG